MWADQTQIIYVLVVLFTALCAYTDYLEYLIFDKITVPLLIIGVLFHLLFGNGVGFSLLGSIPGLIVLILATLWPNKIGAGDGKLLMSIGAWLGWLPVCVIFLFAYYFAVLWSLFKIYIQKKGHTGIPFGVCVFGGVLLYGPISILFYERVRMLGY